MKNKISITTTSFAEHDSRPIDILRNNGFDLALNNKGRALKTDEIPGLCSNCAGIIAGTEKYDSVTLKTLKASGLSAISRCGAGVDNIDLKAAGEMGIRISNTPDAPTEAVAELTVGIIIDLLRNISSMNSGIRNGKWNKEMGNLIKGKKIGIVGFGRIGRRVAEILSGFSAEIAYFDINEKLNAAEFNRKDLNQLLAWSDIITLHCSGLKGGERLINKESLFKMRKGSWIVNTSRGSLIDEKALFEALNDGHIKGAALDVYDKEPYSGPLTELKNVVLTPHAGSYAIESRIQMEIEAAENIIKDLK
ncbi:MAG: phosphoglycerate dehydrogenase [Elusimicrobiota bacterium]